MRETWCSREALRYLDAMRELLAAVGAAPQVAIIEGLYEAERAASGGRPAAAPTALALEEPGKHVMTFTGGKGWSWEPMEWMTAEAEGKGRPRGDDPLAERIPQWDTKLERFARLEVKDRITRHLVLIEAMEALEGEWKSTARFNRLHKAIPSAYESWWRRTRNRATRAREDSARPRSDTGRKRSES